MSGNGRVCDLGSRVEVDLHPHFSDGTPAIGSQNTKRIWIGPFEWLLLPLHPEDRELHPQMLGAFHIIERLYFGLTGVAVKAVCIGGQRPDRFRWGLQIPVPVEIEFLSHVQ